MCVINYNLLGSSRRLNVCQLCYVEQIGLWTFADLPSIELDHNFLTALIERWRPETNTFHFTSGESTITLEDIACIYGLQIDGEPICGQTWLSMMTLTQVFEELLVIMSDNKNCYRVAINFTWLRRNFAEGDPLKKTSKMHDERVAPCLLILPCCWEALLKLIRVKGS